jgi:predicted DNA-binding protein
MPEKSFIRHIISFAALMFCAAVLMAATPQQNAAKPSNTAIPGGALKITASLIPASARVGDTVTLNLAFTLPKGYRLPDKPEITGIENLSITDVKPYPGGIKLIFIADSLDSIPIGPVKLIYLNDRGERLTAASDALILKVGSNMSSGPDKQQLRPIQDIIPAYPLWLPWVLITALAVIIIACAIGVILWLKKRSAMRQSILAAPPHVRARNDLEQLEASILYESGRIKEYYFRFSEIMKRYLEEIRDFPAAESTTEEISQLITLDVDRELLAILKRADMVKFADSIPSPSQKAGDIASAFDYISDTSPESKTIQGEAAQS